MCKVSEDCELGDLYYRHLISPKREELLVGRNAHVLVCIEVKVPLVRWRFELMQHVFSLDVENLKEI